MIEHADKKAIQEHLLEAIDREEMHSRQVALCLNLNPCYISMAKNEKSWDAMGAKAWERLAEWHQTRLPLSEFRIPEGEEIFVPKPYQPKEKAAGEKQKAKEKPVKKLTDSSTEHPIIAESDEHSPDNLLPDKDQVKNSDAKKRLLLSLNKIELEDLREKYENCMLKITELETGLYDLQQSYFVFTDETLPVILARIEALERKNNNIPVIQDMPDKAPRYFALRNIINIHQK